jgi:hypothetical protein
MADNFDMKKFLFENKLGSYSKLKENKEKEEDITILRDIYYFDKLNTLAAKDDVDSKYHSYGKLWAKKGDTFNNDDEEYDMVMNSKRLVKGKDYTTGFQGVHESMEDEKLSRFPGKTEFPSFGNPLEGFPTEYKELLKKLQRSNDANERTELINMMNIIRKKLKLTPLSNILNKKDAPKGGYMGTQYDSSEDMAVDMLKKGVKEDIGGDIGDAEAEKEMDFLAEYADVLVGDEFTPEEMGYTQTGFGTVPGTTYNVVADLGNGKFECEDKSGSKKIFTKREIQMSARPKDQYYRNNEEEAFGGINENSHLMATNPDVKAKVDKIIELLIDIDVDGDTMEYILGAVGMDDQMANQLVHNKAELNEILEPHVYERMYNLSNIKAQQAMIRAAEILMNDLTAEGFEVPEIREFFTQLIANDI